MNRALELAAFGRQIQCRVSTHIFVSTKDIDLLVQDVKEVARNAGA